MHLLKQSTAATVVVGPVLDSTGAAVTSAVVGDFRLAKEGTSAVLSGATVTHDANGYYLVALTTTNTNTVGRLAIYSNNTAHSMGTTRFMVLLASVYDAIVTNATNATGGLPTATGAISALAGAVSTLTAGGVRTELATELGRIDAAVSSRMATYTQPTGFLAATFPTTVASPTNITSASGVVLAGVTHTGAVIPTVTSVSNGVTVSDKTGFKLASDGLALVTAWTVGITGNITGNLSGSVGSVTGAVGSISGVSFPSNFAALGIDPSGAIVSVQAVDELGANALTANGAGDAIETYVWGASLADHTTANTFGARVVRSLNSNNTVQITGGGSYHIFSVIHDSEPNSIHENAFDDGAVSARVIADSAITSAKIATDAITSTQLAASAVTEIKDAIATITPIADLATMITNDGTANARYTVSALQNGPSGEGGQTINVYPVSASTPERVAGTTITFYRDEARAVSVVTDFTLTSLTLLFVIEDNEGTDVLVIEDGNITKSSQTFTVSIPDAVTANPTNYRWALRDVTGSTNSVLARGVFSVQEAASDA